MPRWIYSIRDAVRRVQPIYVHASVFGIGAAAAIAPFPELFRWLGVGAAGIEAPFLVFEICRQALAESLRPLDDIPAALEHTTGVAMLRVEAEVTRAMLRVEAEVTRGLRETSLAHALLSEAPLPLANDVERRAWDTVYAPVAAKTIVRQRHHALISNFRLKLTLLGFEAGQSPLLGRLAVIERVANFDAFAPESADWGDLLPPTLVVSDLAFGLDPFVSLVTAGDVDLLWPTPGSWEDIAAVCAAELRTIPWLEITELTVAGKKVDFPLVPRPSPGMLRDLLGPIAERRGESLDFEALAKVTWMAGGVMPPPGLTLEAISVANTSIYVQSRSTYRVWVATGDGRELPRYAIPFWDSCTVRELEFEVDHGLRDRVQLQTASINTAFRLSVERHRHDRVRQQLTWQSSGDATPFLPGHGVTFHWRENI